MQAVRKVVGTEKDPTGQESGLPMAGWEGKPLQKLLGAGGHELSVGWVEVSLAEKEAVAS